jgi:hypothetical protein
MKRPQHPNPKAYIRWMRLTHNGRRLPSHPVCSSCGSRMSARDRREYNRHGFREEPPDLRSMTRAERDEAKRLYEAVCADDKRPG